MALAIVEKLPVEKLDNVPGMLRSTADKMESGEIETPEMLTLVASTDGKIEIYGFGGSATTAELIGLLEMAKLKLALE